MLKLHGEQGAIKPYLDGKLELSSNEEKSKPSLPMPRKKVALEENRTRA